MKFLRSFRILIFVALFIGNTRSAQADDTLRFNGKLGVYVGNTSARYEDSKWYTLYAEAGQPVELILDYSVYCGFAEGRIDIHIGAMVGSISVPLHPVSQPPPVLSGTETYTRVMPTSDSFQLGLRLTGHFDSMPHGACMLNYTLTVSGATISPSLPPDPILAAEEAAGLERVQDNALPIVIYTPTPNNPDRFIDIRDSEGNPLLYISADELAALPEFPTENLLIASTPDRFVRVYKLTTGEYQVNVGVLADHKVHVTIFDGIPRTHTYGYTWEFS